MRNSAIRLKARVYRIGNSNGVAGRLASPSVQVGLSAQQ